GRGGPVRERAEIKLALPLDAHLPADYVAKEELRLEAYRRLAAVTTEAEVDDIRAEWVDRYGPPPAPAEALLEVARLRAECARLGLREVNVAKGPGFAGPAWNVRLAPLALKVSEQMRLKRLVKDSVYKEEIGQVQVPLRQKTDVVAGLILLLRELIAPTP